MSTYIYDKNNNNLIATSGFQAIDDTLSNTSDNPVKGKVIKQAIDSKQNILTFDSTPTANSTNPIESGGVYTAINTLQSNFQAGCNTIVQAVTAKGQTPASNSPSDIATAIGNISTGGDGHEGLSLEDFNAMTDNQLSALSVGETKYGDDINSNNTVGRNISSGLVIFNIKDFFVSKITKVDPSSSEFDFNTVLTLLNDGDDTIKSSLVGKLVTNMTNSLYSGKYRIIGINHDGTTNTFDLITEDCVASMVFGSSNRHYNDSSCTVRQYVEDTFYNAFSNDVKSHILPMEVVYYYSTSNDLIGTLQTNTAYGKLLSYNEIGYGKSGPSKGTYAPSDVEGNLYPYYNNTTTSLRIKKYNGSNVYWWLRSRYTDNGSKTGLIHTNGSDASSYYYSSNYVAPVLRIG